MDGLVVRRDDTGRHYAAARGYERGQLVLASRPDVWAPLWPSPLHVSKPTPAELAVLRRNPGVRVVSRAGSDEGGGEVFALLAAAWLLAIRALLAHGTPTWARLMSLDDNERLRVPADAAVVRQFARVLCAALDDARGPTEAEAARLLGAILVNGFGTRSAPTEPAPDGLGLFVDLALFNHACAPNAIADFCCAGPADAVSVRALAPIAAGKPVLIAYLDTSEPRYFRRRQLSASKSFACRCARCEDPTDGDLFGSALQCRACARGWQREQVRADGAVGDGSWLCGACGTSTAEREVWAWDARLREKLAAAQQGDGPSSEAYAQVVAEALEWCHPNHAIVVQALVAAVRAHGSAGPDLERTVCAAEIALAALERTAPPFDAQRADVLFQMGAARHELALAARARGHADVERSELLEAASALQRALAQFRVCCGEQSAGSRASHALAGVCLHAAFALKKT